MVGFHKLTHMFQGKSVGADLEAEEPVSTGNAFQQGLGLEEENRQQENYRHNDGGHGVLGAFVKASVRRDVQDQERKRESSRDTTYLQMILLELANQRMDQLAEQRREAQERIDLIDELAARIESGDFDRNDPNDMDKLRRVFKDREGWDEERLISSTDSEILDEMAIIKSESQEVVVNTTAEIDSLSATIKEAKATGDLTTVFAKSDGEYVIPGLQDNIDAVNEATGTTMDVEEPTEGAVAALLLNRISEREEADRVFDNTNDLDGSTNEFSTDFLS